MVGSAEARRPVAKVELSQAGLAQALDDPLAVGRIPVRPGLDPICQGKVGIHGQGLVPFGTPGQSTSWRVLARASMALMACFETPAVPRPATKGGLVMMMVIVKVSSPPTKAEPKNISPGSLTPS